MTKQPKNIRQRKRKVQVTDATPEVEEEQRDPLHPGPQVNWPALPRDDDDNIMPVPPPARIRVMYEQDRTAYYEFLRNTLAAMAAAQRPYDEIARTFGTSLSQVDIWMKWLKEEQRSNWMSRDQLDFATTQEANFRRVIAYSWQQAGATRDSTAKNRWIALAGRMEHALMDLYREARIYRTLPVNRAYGDDGIAGGEDGIRQLHEKAGSMMKKLISTMPKLPNAEDDVPPVAEDIE